MRTLKVAEFDGWGNQHKKLVEFVNQNNIKQEDILKLEVWSNLFLLFYYSADE